MATAETSVIVLNNSVNIGNSSDMEDNIVVRRKTKMNVLTSDDEEDDGDVDRMKIGVAEKEVSNSGEITNNAMDRSNKEIDQLLSDSSNTVKELANQSSRVEIDVIKNPVVGDDISSERINNNISKSDVIKNPVVGDDISSERINNNISKSVDGNEAESEGDLISSYSSKTTLPAEDATDKERPYQIPNRFINILDSDSEDERVFGSEIDKKMSLGQDEFRDSRSASPGSDYFIRREGNEKSGALCKPRRIVSSDSESQEEIDDESKILLTRKSKSSDTPLKSTLNSDHKTGNSMDILKSNKISALIDSDSEEDNPVTNKFGGSSDEGEPITKSNTVRTKEKHAKKKRTGSIRAAKQEAMREIHSETQRMLRESQVCLPYHRPRQRTLQEFLNRRKGLPILSSTLTTAAKVKMSGEIVGKVLEEKEKEAELFYKSSSDSDDDESTKAGFAIANTNPKPMVIVNDVENNIENITTIEETQKLMRINLKDRQSVKEVIQQGDKSLGAPRKLFNSSDDEAEATEAVSPIKEDEFEATTIENQDFNQRHKEFKQGLKDVSIPRKLFGSECVESMDIGHGGNDIIEEIQKDRETNNSQIRVLNKSDQFLENDMFDMFGKKSKRERNESMEEAAEDFVLKMSEDPCEMTNDKIDLYESAIPKTNTIEFEAIIETPVINNREVSKLNQKDVTDSGIIIAEENLTGDDKIKSKDIHLSSVGNEQSSFCNNEDSKNSTETIGKVYGLPLPEFDDDKPKKTRTRILPDIMRFTPKLQGSPDMVIELSPPKVGINQLITRFLNHSTVKKTSESSPEVTTIRTEQTASGLRIVNEVLPYRIWINGKNDDPELSKPGAKLVRLKEDLQQQMAIQRTKEWKQKELEMQTLDADDVYRDERSDCGIETEGDLDDDDDDDEEEEEEEEEELSDSGESEPDEDDLPTKETKHKHKSPFIDAEAEVSEEESEEKEEERVSDDEDREDADDIDSYDSDDKGEEREERETGSSRRNKTWKLKRIAKVFEDDDSNDDEVKEKFPHLIDAGNNCHFRRKETDVDMFATDNNSDDDWLSSTEGDLPVYQRGSDERSEYCATPSVVNNCLSIVSPITQLTALNTGSESVNRDSNLVQNPLQLMAPLSVEMTPIEAKCHRECDSEKREKLQKKLFDDIKETPSEAELIGLCSDPFSNNPSDNRELERFMHTARNAIPTDAELLDLCSGTFPTQPSAINKLEAFSDKIEADLVPSSNSPFPSSNKSSEEQSQTADTIPSTMRIVFSSDDENNTQNSQVKNARRKTLKKTIRKLELSDDEEASNDGNLSDLDGRENGEEKFVDYDSEENEIVVLKKDVRKVAAGFLDEEAELSESEWGSADEDERDLDKLDLEEGDLEDIDQNQVKKQLERIHMRQVLDADQREVRLLQEILLKDGELHSDSASRQRKFKWKNIDELGEDSEGHLHSVDEEGVSVDPIEAESELEWRKQRLEREQFLKEQKITEAAADIEEEKEDSQLFQLGIRALKKKKNSKVSNKDASQLIVADESQLSVTRHTVADLFASPGCGKKTFALQNAIHRGSFLARGEESLARLSLITKQNSDQAIIRTNKSRNFVFAHLSPAIETSVEGEESDGQKNTDSMDTKLRKRKSAFSLTPVASKKSKKEYEQNNTRSKLFR